MNTSTQLKADSIEAKVGDKLREYGVSYRAIYSGQQVKADWNNQSVDAYRVKFNDYETSYYMGLGNRKAGMHVNPVAASVLYSLLSDAEAVHENFTEWAENLGYDNDSIKALNVYNACCETGKALRKVFTPEQMSELRELLKDY